MRLRFLLRSLLPLALLASAPAVGFADDSSSSSLCGRGGSFRRLEVIGLTADQRLICFDESAPNRARNIGRITGLVGGDVLVGIDFRPANGQLVGLGSQGGIYVINPADATAVRRANANVPLAGASFGVDFNPVPDRLRVTSDTGQNLRINVDDGTTLVDGALNPAPGTGVTGVAYTNNDGDPNTNTVLYDLDTLNDQISIQAPPNAGTLTPVGRLLIDSLTDVGFDIFSQIKNGSTDDVRALASLAMAGNVVRFFTIDLTTGRATLQGAFAANNRVIGIAIPLVQGRS